MQRYQFDLINRTHGPKAWNDFLEIMAELPPVGKGGPWLCGGAIRRVVADGENTSDFDYFFADKSQVDTFTSWMQQHGGTIVRTTATNTTWSLKKHAVQQISLRYYGSIEEVLDSFDFTICQFGWDGEMLAVGPYALWDLGRKKLALHKLTYGVSTLRRLMKYARQGFTICGGALADILQRTIEDPGTVNANIVSLD